MKRMRVPAAIGLIVIVLSLVAPGSSAILQAILWSAGVLILLAYGWATRASLEGHRKPYLWIGTIAFAAMAAFNALRSSSRPATWLVGILAVVAGLAFGVVIWAARTSKIRDPG